MKKQKQSATDSDDETNGTEWFDEKEKASLLLLQLGSYLQSFCHRFRQLLSLTLHDIILQCLEPECFLAGLSAIGLIRKNLYRQNREF